MIRLWRSLAYNHREGGIRQILRKTASRFREWLQSETVCLIYRADPGNFRGKTNLPLVRREPGFDSLHERGYFKARAFPETTRARLDAGERCHGFFLGGELVSVAWTTRGRLVLETAWSIDAEDCLGIFDCYTLPAYRSKGIYTDVLIQLLRLAWDEGTKTALIAANPGNHPSIKGIEKAGFTPLFQIARHRRFGRQSFERSEFQPLYSKLGPV